MTMATAGALVMLRPKRWARCAAKHKHGKHPITLNSGEIQPQLNFDAQLQLGATTFCS
jgi:hypothetical protein